MRDAWRAYLELALGMTEASRKRAQTVARGLVGQSGATAAQLQALAEELVTTGIANRSALTKMIRVEVDRALAALGLATADEVADLTGRVATLERELRAVRTTVAPAAGAAGAVTAPAGGTVRPGSAAALATGAEKAAVKKAVAKATAREVAVEPGAAGKTVVKKTVAKKTVVKKAVAKKLPPTAS